MNRRDFFLLSRQSRILIVSLIPAIAAFLVSLLYTLLSGPYNFYDLLWSFLPLGIPATLAAAITGASCWWFAIERPAKFTQMRFILAGLLCGIISHPVLWVSFLAIGSIAEEPLQSFDLLYLFEVMAGVLFVTVMSLVIAGWATAAIGAGGGWLFWKWCGLGSEK